MSPASAPAASLNFRSTLSQWLFWPFWLEHGLKRRSSDGAFDRRHAPRGSLALAFFGRMRKVQVSFFSSSAGRKSLALKRIVVLVIC